MNSTDGALHFQPRLDLTQLNSDVAKMKSMISGISQKAVHESNTINKSMTQVLKYGGAYLSIQGARQFIGQIVSIRGEFQQLEVAFSTMLQSKDKANKMMRDVVNFAAKTPFQLSEVAGGTKQLLAYRIEQEKIIPTLKALGDVSAGLSVPIGRLILNYGQVKTAAKLTGRELRDFNMAGVPLIAELSKNLGKSETDIQAMVSAGKIGFKEVEEAFKTMTSEGGRFADLMDKQSATITGKISNLQDNIEKMFNDIGQANEGIINDAIDGIGYLVEHYREVGHIIAELIALYGSYRAGLIVMTATQMAMTEVTKGYTLVQQLSYKWSVLLEKAQKVLNKTMLANPYVAVGVAVAGLVYGIYKLATAETEAERVTRKTNETLSEQKDFIQKEKDKTHELIGAIKDETTTRIEKNEALATLQKKYPKLFEGMDIEAIKVAKLSDLYKQLNIEIGNRSMSINKSDLSELDRLIPKLQGYFDYDGGEWEEQEKSVNDFISEKELERIAEITGLEYDGWYDKTFTLLSTILKEGNAKREALSGIVKNQETAKYKASKDDKFSKLNNAEKVNTRKGDLLAYEQELKIVNNKIEEAKKKNAGIGVSQLKAEREAVKEKIKATEKEISNLQKSNKFLRYKSEITKELASTNEIVNKFQERYNSNDKSLTTEEVQEYKEALTKRKELNKELQEYTGVSKKESGNKSEAKKLREKAEAEKSWQIKYRREQEDALYEANRRKIEIEQDGEAESLALLKLEGERKLQLIERQREDKMAELEKESQQAKEQDRDFDLQGAKNAYNSIYDGQILSQKGINKNAEITKQQENFKSILQEYETYEQKWLRLAEEYQKKRDALYEIDSNGEKHLREGVTQGNVDLINEDENTVFDALNEEFASKEETFRIWCNQIAIMSLDELENQLRKAEKELKKLEKSGKGSPQELAEARAKVVKAKKTISASKEEINTAPEKQSIEKWNALREALDDGAKSFENIGKEIGGVAGDMFSAIGSISSMTISVINNIVTLTTSSASAMTITSQTASASVKAVEKASVILAIIGTALQIAMKIASMFNNDKQKQAEIEALQGRIDELQWEIDHLDIIRLQKNRGKALDIVRDKMHDVYILIKAQRDEIIKQEGVWAYFRKRRELDNKLIEMSAKRIADVYAKIEYTADKALGDDKFSGARDQMEKMAQQQVMLQKQIDAEQSKKKTDSKKVKEMKQKMEELGHEMVELINGLVEDIVGGSASEIANELGDAFFEAFSAGEDYAEAWGNKVDDIVGNIVKKMLISKFLEKPLGEIFDKYKPLWFGKKGEFAGIDAVMSSMGDFKNELNNLGSTFGQIIEGMGDDMLNLIPREEIQDEREADKKEPSLSSMTQDQASALEGKFTLSVELQRQQLNITQQIAENTAFLKSNSALQLEHLENIDTNTARLEKIESGIATINSDFEDIKTKGIKIRK